jgi:hypothetical protein
MGPGSNAGAASSNAVTNAAKGIPVPMSTRVMVCGSVRKSVIVQT